LPSILKKSREIGFSRKESGLSIREVMAFLAYEFTQA